MNLENWFKKHTFHHNDFNDLKALVKAKEKTGLTVSLCIPTLNEAKTIGKEVVLFKSELMRRHKLIDEIAVIDSGSSDNTLEVAENFGADVYLSSEILPETGTRRGKGENLWKAIHQLKGDIICYIDADIKNIHPRFAYGLLAPLFYREEIKYVKAFYDRPLALPNVSRPSGGGRVTEILVRPLFSLFFPELTYIMQPLSGEYAARREVLERIPFPIGYGVETSHLLDVYRLFGMSAFAQTDLDKRVHKNQPIKNLGRMAFGILQTFFSRLEDFDMAEMPVLGKTHLQIEALKENYKAEEFSLVEEERPPMNEIKAYRAKRGLEVENAK